MAYTQYQSVVNGRVFESAQANAEALANSAGTRMGRSMGYGSAVLGLLAGLGLVAVI